MKEATYLGTVYPWHCDHMGHMNVMWYTGKFDEATWQFFGSLGLTPDFLRANSRGMVAVEQLIEYKQELHAGDLVRIETELLTAGSKSIKFRHSMYKRGDDEPASLSTITGVFLDTSARKSAAFPEELSSKFKSMISAI